MSAVIEERMEHMFAVIPVAVKEADTSLFRSLDRRGLADVKSRLEL